MVDIVTGYDSRTVLSTEPDEEFTFRLPGGGGPVLAESVVSIEVEEIFDDAQSSTGIIARKYLFTMQYVPDTGTGVEVHVDIVKLLAATSETPILERTFLRSRAITLNSVDVETDQTSENSIYNLFFWSMGAADGVTQIDVYAQRNFVVSAGNYRQTLPVFTGITSMEYASHVMNSFTQNKIAFDAFYGIIA